MCRFVCPIFWSHLNPTLSSRRAVPSCSSACPDALNEARTLMEPSNGKVFEVRGTAARSFGGTK